MNILYVVTKLDKSERANEVIRSARYLTLNGHKAVVASEKSKRVRKIDEVGARHYPLSLKANIFLIFADIFRLSNIIVKENIRVVHAVDGLSAFVAFFASRMKERTFVSTIYEHKRRGLFDAAELWAKRIIVASESETCFFSKDHVFLQEKICLIPPSVSLNGYPQTRETTPGGKASPPNGEFVIGAIVPLSSQEAMTDFVRSISILVRSTNKVRVLVKGTSSVPLKGAEEKFKLIVKRHLSGNFLTVLPQNEEDKNILCKADLFVQVNLDKEIFARPLLEAAAMGIPVVVTDADWIKDYVEYNRTALVSPGKSPQDLASRMLEIYRNKELRKELVAGARNYVREAFDIKKIMAATLRLYEEATEGLNILIIKTGALGDVILAVPSIRAIRKKYPKAKIKLLTSVDKRDIFANSPYINEVIVCDFKGRDRGLGRFLSIAGKLRYEDFDLVIDLQNNKRSHILSFLSFAPKRYGYDNGKFSILLNRKIKDLETPVDPVTHQSRVLGMLGIFSVDRSLELWPSEEDGEWADRFLESHWVKKDAPVIAVNLRASPRWLTKLWPPEYFAEVTNLLAAGLGVRVLLIGQEKNDKAVEDYLKKAKCKPIDALGKTSIPRLASLMKKCSVLLSGDSAPLHVAASVGTPFVALFGPTDPERHVISEGQYIVLRNDFQCSPCYKTHCNRGYRCMRSIKPKDVYKAVAKLLRIRNGSKKWGQRPFFKNIRELSKSDFHN